MTSTSPALARGSDARPVDGGERLVLLDSLRGFALCGVFVSNLYMWFSGRSLLSPAQIEAAMKSASWLDVSANYFVTIFVLGKFVTIFSFLFGLGFAVQLSRAEARGASVAPLYARRLTVMLVMGLAHLFLLWCGDILSTYATLGFALLLFYKRRDRTLLAWAAALVVISPIIGVALLRLPMLIRAPEAAAALQKELMAHSVALRAQVFQAYSGSSYLTALRANARYFMSELLAPSLVFVFALLGRFLLGLVAGRRRLFHDAPEHLSLFRRLLGWGLLAGVLTSAIVMTVQQLALRKLINPQGIPWLPMVMLPIRQVSELGMASVYVSGIVLLFQRPWWRRLLSMLAPVGRMALTNYLSQTVISLFLFNGYGLGLIGKLGPAQCIALPVGIFCLQVALSHAWLARFRFGPAEWVWRSLTYGKAQPMRHERAPAVEALTAG